MKDDPARLPPGCLSLQLLPHYNHKKRPTTADNFMTSLELTEHSEHRNEPRYRHLLPVRIGSLEMTTANVSLHGLQIVCPVMRFKRIEKDVRSGQLGAQVILPRGAPFDATLSVRYCSRYGDEVLIGARMAVTDTGAQAQWAAYIGDVTRGFRLTPERAAGP